jgi:hypothetical protein
MSKRGTAISALMDEHSAKVQIMAGEQSIPPTIFEIYMKFASTQFAFAQTILHANAKMSGLWRDAPEANAEEDRPSVAARLPDLMSA